MTKKRTVIVNATAAKQGGALSILQQFLDIVAEVNDDTYTFIVFIDSNLKYSDTTHVHFVKHDTRSWSQRIWWDEKGLKRWCSINQVTPNALISLQNTGVNWNIPQIIYYHQLLPLSQKNWNPFKKKEFKLFCYKCFYSYFVRNNLHADTNVIVQTPSIKDAFVRKFHISEQNVKIVKPKTNIIDYSKISAANLDKSFFHFIYPAASSIYKNHIELIKVVYNLLDVKPMLRNKLKIHFTLKPENNKTLYKEILDRSLKDIFELHGTMPFKTLLGYYKSCDALLFPSYIETFGLPLIEAAEAGLPVIAVDLPYVHEAIGQYQGVRFVKLGDINGWVKEISEICSKHTRYNPFIPANNNDWLKIFEILNDIIK